MEKLEATLVPRVGVVVFLMKGRSTILGQRLSIVGNSTFALLGGHLKFGESLEECAMREVEEEMRMEIAKTEFVTVMNNVMVEEPKPYHLVTIFMTAESTNTEEELKNMKTTIWSIIEIS